MLLRIKMCFNKDIKLAVSCPVPQVRELFFRQDGFGTCVDLRSQAEWERRILQARGLDGVKERGLIVEGGFLSHAMRRAKSCWSCGRV